MLNRRFKHQKLTQLYNKIAPLLAICKNKRTSPSIEVLSFHTWMETKIHKNHTHMLFHNFATIPRSLAISKYQRSKFSV